MNRLSAIAAISLTGLIATSRVQAHPRIGAGVHAVAHVARHAACVRAPCHYYRGHCYRPYCHSWGFGFGYSPVYYGGYAAAPVYYESAPVAEQPPGPPPEITQWSDEDLRNMAGDKFTATRGLDAEANRVSIELVNKEYHDETGALVKAKFRVRWVEWKISRTKDGREIREEKQKSTSVKLKFDELGRFTEYDD